MTDPKSPQQIVDDLLHPKEESDKKPVHKKEIETQPKVKDKHYYEIRVESLLPATITYRVLAEDPEQALELMRGQTPIGVKHRLHGKKDNKLTVRKSGSSMVELTKNLSGR
jgi:hypothetical protein